MSSNEVSDEVVFQTRRSTRTRTPVDHFTFEKSNKTTRKRKLEENENENEDSDSDEPLIKKSSIEEKISNELVAKDLGNSFSDIYLNNLEQMSMSLKRLMVRSKALKKTLKNAQEIVDKNYVTATKNGEYLVTSSCGTKTYRVHSAPLSDRIHYMCNCGRQYDKGDRVSCKHIFATILMTLSSVSNLFFQVSTKQTVQDLHELCSLTESINIKKHTDDFDIQKNQQNAVSKSPIFMESV